MAVYQGEKTKDGRSWYFTCYKKDYNNVNKKYKSKKYHSKKEAQEEERLFLMKRDNPINKPFYLIAEEYIDHIYKTRKESTGYSYEVDYKRHIKPYFERFNISDINISTIRFWKEDMEKKNYSLKYLNNFYNILKGIFDYAIKNYGLNKNPMQIVGRFEQSNEKIIIDKDKIRYITLEDFNKFISIIDSPLWYTFFNFLFYTGCRKGEVQALTWKDIDFDNNEVIVNKTLSIKTTDVYKITSTKNYVNRKIKMSKKLKNILTKYKNEVMKYTDFSEKWFVFGNTRFLPQTSISRYKHHYFKMAGLEEKEITIHEFRHSHVSLLINEYIKSGQTDTAKFFLMMSNRMGHSIEVMQQTYMHLFPTIQNEIVDILDNL